MNVLHISVEELNKFCNMSNRNVSFFLKIDLLTDHSIFKKIQDVELYHIIVRPTRVTTHSTALTDNI